MPKIALHGFPSGTLRVKVAQNETVAEATIGLEGGVQDPPLPDEPTGDRRLVLSVNRRVGTAPAGFFFSVKAEGFGVRDPYYDVRYKWTFSDPGHYTRHDTDDLPWGKYYNVDGKAVLVEDGRKPAGKSVTFLGNDKNVAFGPHACHVFEKPGRYTVTCEARVRGAAPVSQTMQVEVEDPEVYFVGPATICVSPSGNFEGAPDRALTVKTFAEAIDLAEKSSSDSVRILLHRGEKHETPKDRSLREPSRNKNWRRLFYGPFGSGGSDPIYGPYPLTVKGNQGGQGEGTVYGLRYDGGYNPADPWLRNPGSQPPVDSAVSLGGATYTTLWNCSLVGGNSIISISTNSSNIAIGNTFVGSWHDYGIYAGQGLGTTGFSGVWIKQHPDTVIGGEGKFESTAPFYQDHAPFRCSALAGPVAFNLCDLRSIGSWAGYFQPCLRIGRSSVEEGLLIEEANMDRLRGENGGMLGTGNSGMEAYPRRYLWDKIYLVRATVSDPIFNASVSGLEYRNVVVVIPNTPYIGGAKLTRWIWRGEAHRAGAVDDPLIGEFGVRVYNSTLVDLRDAKNFEAQMILWDPEDMGAYGYVDITNNILWVPNRPDAAVGDKKDEPLNLTPLWFPTNKGIRYREDPFAPIYGTAPDAAAYYSPLPESPAYQGAEPGRPVAIDDFFGRLRPAKPSRGAIEPI